MDIAARIAHRIKQERQLRGWSLDALAARAQVSRAMISKIERRASTPTAVLLARLANAMDMSLSALMFEQQSEVLGHTVHRVDAQTVWQDPASGHLRRMVSPARRPGEVDIVASDLPAGARLQFLAADRVRIDAQVLLLQGALHIVVNSELIALQPGDCARVALHCAHEVHNPGDANARYLVITRQLPLEPPPGDPAA